MHIDVDQDLSFNPSTVDWTVRFMSHLIRALSLNIKIHHPEGRIEEGDIYLFNHFARFETFIPQYLLYRQTGVLSRSVASAEFFANPTLSRFLRGLGAIPNNHPRLLPFLAAEVLKGRKVVIFPEGGMVKDRRVVDEQGQYSVYSRSAHKRRKHHSGAAVLALMLDCLKSGILALHADKRPLDAWTRSLEMSEEQLLAAASKPTRLVPGNITFYPLRADENAMHRMAEALAKLNAKAAEELLVESNILLRNTDMDIRLGAPMIPAPSRSARWRREVVAAMERTGGVEAFFALAGETRNGDAPLADRVFSRHMHQAIDHLRNDSMRAIYRETTVNLSHLAASLMQNCLRQGTATLLQSTFHKALFLSIKALQKREDVHLHRGLTAPERYAGVIDNSCRGLIDFLASAESSQVLEREPISYRFHEKLLDRSAFDAVRIDNPIQVYANEAAPVKAVEEAACLGLAEAVRMDDKALAHRLFEEERHALSWAKEHFNQPRFADINAQETASEPAEPYWMLPEYPRRVGVLLVHGLLASPSELSEFGLQLVKRNYAVLGIRLAGHGTSPWDLRKKSWRDWQSSVRRGIRILSPFVDEICLVGFSTGGALSLITAAEHPAKLVGVVACSTPLKMKNKNLLVVPFVHSANEIIRRLSERDGIVTFRPNDSEHPHINYKNIPISALNEFKKMIEEMVGRLPLISTPTLVIQATDDHVVDPRSAMLIDEKLTDAPWRKVVMIESARHGILNENIGDARAQVIRFLDSLCAE